MERITTTERPDDELRIAVAENLLDETWAEGCDSCAGCHWDSGWYLQGLCEAHGEVAKRESLEAADALLAIIEPLVRVRVVEGLVASIKALPVMTYNYGTADDALMLLLADVLAVVEAAREDG